MIPNSETEAQIALKDGRPVRVSDTKPQELPICPLCEGGSTELFKKNGHMLHQCQDCGHRFVDIAGASDHVARVYSDEYFNGGTGGYPNYLADGELQVDHGKRYARVLSRYLEPGTILDVGAAAGFILKGFEEMGWKGTGIEPNSAMTVHAQRRLGLNVTSETLEDANTGSTYDVISMIQIVPHLINPRRALTAANGMTKPGGYWLIETWNKHSKIARILGRSWHEYNPPSVLHWFSKSSLDELVRSFGLQPVAQGRPTKLISPAHARSVLSSEPGSGAIGTLIESGLKLIPAEIRLPYIFDDVFWALYHKPEH